ncbi:MAG: thioesterase family protein [Acidobacteria bacterium]|nr:thioesterase family protein [Acidobacteriota bacterium]
MPSTSSRVRVRYAETDAMGIAYYGNYFTWFEVGRTDLLRRLGRRYRDLERDGILLPVVEALCSFRAPARYDDELEVSTRGGLRSAVRVEFRYEVHRPDDGTLLATGHTLHAATDATGRPRRLPSEIRALLT